MKNLIITLFILIIPQYVFALAYNAEDMEVKLYGTIYGDLFYSHGASSLLNNFYGTGSQTNTITTNASFGSTKLGLNINYKKVEVNFEAGIPDPVRKFYFKYHIDRDNQNYILVGRDTNIAHYYFGQMSNDGQALNDYGSIISRRRMQIRYGIKGVEIALIIPYINFSNADDIAYTKKDKMREYIFYQIPRIEVAYNYKTSNLYLKPFLSYGVYLYNVNNNSYLAHQYTIGLGGRNTADKFFIDYMLYFGQNMYLNSSYGGYSGFALLVNPLNIDNNKIKINNYYSTGGGLGVGYYYNKFLFQLGVGFNYNYNEKFINTQISAGSYINTRYYFSDIFSVLVEVAYLNNIYDVTKTNKGSALISGCMFILSF